MQPVFAISILLGITIQAYSADWPQYLGAAGDNSSPETIRTNWTEQAPREVWRKPIGAGFSSMAVVGNRVYTQAKETVGDAAREFCVALDASTGEALWKANLDAAEYTNLSGYPDSMDGPRSTPTVEAGRIYVLTSHLQLYCLDATNGKTIWHRDFPSELGSRMIDWENAASPLVVGDLILLNSNVPGNRLMAVRKSDGATVWSGQDGPMTHATPVFARLGDVGQVIFLTLNGLVSVVPESGVVLWSVPFGPSSTSTAASPSVSGDRVYASAAYGYGTWMSKVTKTGDRFNASEVWRQRGTTYQAHWSTPVVQDGFMYCVPAPSSGQGRLTCLDVVGGTNRWAQSNVGSGTMGYGSLIRAANVLVVLTEGGELVLVEANPVAYTEVARLKILDEYCWNHATLAGGRIFARSTSSKPEIVAVDVSAPASPATPLSLGATRGANGSTLQLSISAMDGAALEPSRLNGIQVLTSTNVGAPVGEWSVVNPVFIQTNGMWLTEILVGTNLTEFLRIRESTASGTP